MFDISVIIPSIRIANQPRLVQSIYRSTKRNVQVIFAGPALHPNLQVDPKISFVKTFRAPTPASNMAAMLVEAPVLTYTADDCVYFPDELDRSLDTLATMGDYCKNVVINKYTENGNLLSDRECYLNFAYPRSPYIPDTHYIFNIALMYTDFFFYLDGWDNAFQGTCVAHADFAARAQRNRAIVKLLNTALFAADHEPGTSGSHAPIHHCQVEDDEPLYRRYWCEANSPLKRTLKVEDWKKTPTIWQRRFNVAA